MKQATLHQLQILEAIARHGSFTRAAEELELTQPTVSQQIKRLTQIIGMPLFEQLGKQIYLTAAGQEVLAASAIISEKFAELEIAIDEIKGLKQGRINLVASTPPNILSLACWVPFGANILILNWLYTLPIKKVSSPD